MTSQQFFVFFLFELLNSSIQITNCKVISQTNYNGQENFQEEGTTLHGQKEQGEERQLKPDRAMESHQEGEACCTLVETKVSKQLALSYDFPTLLTDPVEEPDNIGKDDIKQQSDLNYLKEAVEHAIKLL